MKIHFLHLRNSVYFRGKFQELEAKGGATVAYTFGLVNYGDAENTRVVIKGAVAICDPRDHYVKKEGRLYASDVLSIGAPTSRIFHIDLGPKDDHAFKATGDGDFDVMHETAKIRKLVSREALRIVDMESFPHLRALTRSTSLGCVKLE